jgi:hypothetical protein
MLHGRGLIEDSAHIRFVNPLIVRPVALAWHPRPALTAHLFAPCEVGMVLADPTDAEADRTLRICHA